MTPVILHQIAPSGSSAGKRLQYKKLIHDPSCTIYVLNRGGKWTRMYRLFMIQRVKAKKNIRHINITSHVYTIIPFIFVYNILIISYIYIFVYYIYDIQSSGMRIGIGYQQVSDSLVHFLSSQSMITPCTRST